MSNHDDMVDAVAYAVSGLNFQKDLRAMRKKRVMKTVISFILLSVLACLLVACGKDGGFKKREYLINDEWLHCSQTREEACGLTLVCEDQEVFTCMTNIQTRAAE